MTAIVRFPTTRWTVLYRANSPDTQIKNKALNDLAEAYWRPVYGYLRRKGLPPSDAADLTQDVLMRFCNEGRFSDAESGRGKFRTFLLACLNNLARDGWRRASAQKRAPEELLLNVSDFEETLASSSSTGSPELEFDRNWLAVVLDRATNRLRDHYRAKGKQEIGEHICGHLRGDPASLSHSEAAVRFGLSHEAMRQEVSRGRGYLRHFVVEEVAATVGDPILVEQELRHLLSAWQS